MLKIVSSLVLKSYNFPETLINVQVARDTGQVQWSVRLLIALVYDLGPHVCLLRGVWLLLYLR